MEIVLTDGDLLDSKIEKSLNKYLKSSDNKYFEKTTGPWKVIFVGYLNFKIDEINYRIYSFPKHYEPENIDNEMKKIIAIFKKVNFTVNGVECEEQIIFGSLFYAFINVEEYYLNFGMYNYRIKNFKKGKSGKIDWRKTIIKQKSLLNNNNVIFNKYVIEKKEFIDTFLTDIMKYVLNIAHEYFPFYFNKYNFKYNQDIIYKNNSMILNQLIELRKDTFGDENIILLENLIIIFSQLVKSFASGCEILTKNFELIWEEMIARISDSSFSHKKKYYIDDDKKRSIEIDHLNNKEKIIMDSKYYSDINKKNNEYKQYFYGYHLKAITKFTWINVLIKPTCGVNLEFKFHTQRENIDGLSLYDLIIPIKKVVTIYLANEQFDFAYEIKSRIATNKNNI